MLDGTARDEAEKKSIAVSVPGHVARVLAMSHRHGRRTLKVAPYSGIVVRWSIAANPFAR